MDQSRALRYRKLALQEPDKETVNCCNCWRMKRIVASYARSSGHVTARKSKPRSSRAKLGMTKIAGMTRKIPRGKIIGKVIGGRC